MSCKKPVVKDKAPARCCLAVPSNVERFDGLGGSVGDGQRMARTETGEDSDDTGR